MRKSIILFNILILVFFAGCIRKNEPHRKPLQKDSTETEKYPTSPTDNEFLFVGVINNKAGLYKYNFTSKTQSEYWNSNKDDVIDFSYSNDLKAAFMLTAKEHGKKGIFPFVDKVKLYFVKQDSTALEFVEEIGSGLQVFSFWETDSVFKVVLNFMDVSVGKYLEQYIKRYNYFGKKLSDEKKRFELAKDGFPKIPTSEKKLTSPNFKYSLEEFDSVFTEIYLLDNSDKQKKVLITKQNQKLNFVDWTIDNKFLIFTTLDISPMNETLYEPEPNTSKLFIYSLSEKKLVKIFEGGGIKNFLLLGNILIFDDGFEEKSKIFIYNFKSQKITDSISVTGGCGLKNIPSIPDYEA